MLASVREEAAVPQRSPGSLGKLGCPPQPGMWRVGSGCVGSSVSAFGNGFFACEHVWFPAGEEAERVLKFAFCGYGGLHCELKPDPESLRELPVPLG